MNASTIETLAGLVVARVAEYEAAKQEYSHARNAANDALNKQSTAEKALKEATAKLMEALPK